MTDPKDEVIKSLQAEIEGLRGALEFYADPWEWQKRPGNEKWLRSDGDAEVPDFYDEMAFGEKAMAVLAGDKP